VGWVDLVPEMVFQKIYVAVVAPPCYLLTAFCVNLRLRCRLALEYPSVPQHRWHVEAQ
jgi:hypothetical protein